VKLKVIIYKFFGYVWIRFGYIQKNKSKAGIEKYHPLNRTI